MDISKWLTEWLSGGEVAHLPHRVLDGKYGRKGGDGKRPRDTTVTTAAGEIHGWTLKSVAEIVRSTRIFAQIAPPKYLLITVVNWTRVYKFPACELGYV